MSLETINHTPVTQLLSQTTLKRNNIIVGDHEPQIRFFEQQTETKANYVDNVTDMSLFGHSGLLFVVSHTYKMVLSKEVAGKTGIWSASPIVPGSAALHALSKYAFTLAFGNKAKPDKDLQNRVEKLLVKDEIADIRCLLWKAVEAYRNDKGPVDEWFEPWQAPLRWIPPGVDTSYRLRSLYRKLLTYSFMRGNRQDSLQYLDVLPSIQNKLKDLTLDLTKVYRSLEVLNTWASFKGDDYTTAAQISAIWT